MKIADLPFRERPVLDLLNIAAYRDAPDHDYAGYGWARVPRLWLVDAAGARTAVDDVLLLAVHTADDAPVLLDDLQLEFDPPAIDPPAIDPPTIDPPFDASVAVMATKFLATWLPRLPTTRAIVLCVCNPHRATLALDRALWLPMGDVHSWRDHDTDDILLTAETWRER